LNGDGVRATVGAERVRELVRREGGVSGRREGSDVEAGLVLGGKGYSNGLELRSKGVPMILEGEWSCKPDSVAAGMELRVGTLGLVLDLGLGLGLTEGTADIRC
jgi:hypothetical protein